jgi:hypothetical protein
METLWIFPGVDPAAKAVETLIREGFPEEEITSLTSVAYPEGVLVRTAERFWFRWAAVAGGVIGAIAGFGLAAGTALLYPVQTGDKPIIAFYPAGIITFELTMLGAMLGTIAGMFLEIRLPPRTARPYDPAVSGECIGISLVTTSADELRRAEEIMDAAGALSCTSFCGTPMAPPPKVREGRR